MAGRHGGFLLCACAKQMYVTTPSRFGRDWKQHHPGRRTRDAVGALSAEQGAGTSEFGQEQAQRGGGEEAGGGARRMQGADSSRVEAERYPG
eukprot:3353147-Rhodomonas_salina.1